MRNFLSVGSAKVSLSKTFVLKLTYPPNYVNKADVYPIGLFITLTKYSYFLNLSVHMLSNIHYFLVRS